MTRIMPFVFETTDTSDWEDTFFWTPRQVEKPTKTSDNKPEYEILPCRGEFLLTCKKRKTQIKKIARLILFFSVCV